jgi:hypothetical protein
MSLFSQRQFRLIGAFAAVNVVLVVAGWVGFVGPQRNAASSAAAAAAIAQSQLQALQKGSGSHGPVKQPAIHTACLYKLATALPSQADQPELLFELDHLAKASNVHVVGISPQSGMANPAGYTVQPINVQLNGSYYNLTLFLRNLRTLVADHHGCPSANGQLFAVNSVSITPQTSGDAPATVQIEAFYYGVTAGAAPPMNTTDTTTTTTEG